MDYNCLLVNSGAYDDSPNPKYTIGHSILDEYNVYTFPSNVCARK